MLHILKAGLNLNESIWTSGTLAKCSLTQQLHVSKIRTVTKSWHHQITNRGHLTMDNSIKLLQNSCLQTVSTQQLSLHPLHNEVYNFICLTLQDQRILLEHLYWIHLALHSTALQDYILWECLANLPHLFPLNQWEEVSFCLTFRLVSQGYYQEKKT